MQQPLKDNPIPKDVSIKDQLKELYNRGSYPRTTLLHFVRTGKLTQGDYFYITGKQYPL